MSSGALGGEKGEGPGCGKAPGRAGLSAGPGKGRAAGRGRGTRSGRGAGARGRGKAGEGGDTFSKV